MRKVTKQSMERQLMSEFGLGRDTARAIVTALLSSMSDALEDGGKVLLKGVGTIEVKELAERVHNGFGKQFKVDAKRTTDFTPSDTLVEKLNVKDAVGLDNLLSTLRKKNLENNEK